MSKLIHKIAVIITAALCLLPPATADARSVQNADDPAWSVHSSFYNRPRRIIDTPQRTYFFVHPGVYHSTAYAKYYTDIAGTIFYVDKDNIEGGMKDLARKVPFSGFDMILADANPVTSELVVAYRDGSIDLIYPDWKVSHIDALKKAPNYNLSSITNISFDRATGDILVSTKGGFITIDPASGTVRDFAEWNQPVTDIIRAGNRHVAIINNRICMSAQGSDPTDISAYSEVPNVTLKTPLRLLAFSDAYFGFIGNGGEIILVSHNPGGSWTAEQVWTADSNLLEDAYTFLNRVEHNVHPVPDGYIINSLTAMCSLTGNQSGGKPQAAIQGLPSGSSRYVGTCDGKSFWLYNSQGKFVRFDLNGNSWAATSQPMLPEAPHTPKDVYFLYSPLHGFLCVNKFSQFKAANVDRSMPVTVDSFRGGAWADLSPRKNPPYFVADDPAKLTTWNAQRWYPLNASNGCLIDPLNPDVLMTASVWDGFAALYLDDPRKQSHVHVHPNSNYINNFGAISSFPQSTWGEYVGLCLLGTDADDNIWATRSNLYPVDNSSQSLMQLWVWTPEARRQALISGNPAEAGPWKHMEVDGGFFTEFSVIGTTLRHPKNRNKFLLNGQVTNSKGRPMRIYDTKGTLDDSSDDTLTDVNFFMREDGNRGSAGNILCYLEDPSNGDILVFSGDDLFIIDLNDDVVSNTMKARSLSLDTEDGNKFIPLTPTRGYAACFDEYGRLWIGTQHAGVYGISADRKKIIAQYNADNSPLPSNCIYGLGWNPETKSLFISTAETIMEVRVDAPRASSASVQNQAIVLVPSSVTPDFAGTVAIHNVPDGTALRVRDRDGKTVAVIENGENGIAHWNLLDADGNRVPTGLYTITDASGAPKFQPVSLPVIR